MKKTVLMISANNFPDGDAGAVRDLSFAKIYRQLGYSPLIVCLNKSVDYGIYDDIEYFSYYLQADSAFEKILRYIKQKRLFLQIVKKIEKKYKIPDLIHLYGVSNNIVSATKKYAGKRNIQIIHDSVEWYSSCEFKYGIFDKAYILNNILNTYLIQRPIKVIAISSYLKSYFESKQIFCERIPVIFDVLTNSNINVRSDKLIKLIYAGSPAKKDYLKEIVNSVKALSDEERKRVELNIYGATKEHIISLCGFSELPSWVIAHGRVLREEVVSALNDSDFSLLLRPENERYTKAGFPTKVVEAMSHGVGMICNLTSDLKLYLEDEKNSVIVQGSTEEAMTSAIRRVLKMDREKINEIKSCARKTAEEEFDYRKWIGTVQRLTER